MAPLQNKNAMRIFDKIKMPGYNMRIANQCFALVVLQVPQMVHHLELVRAAAPPSIPQKTKNERGAANG